MHGAPLNAFSLQLLTNYLLRHGNDAFPERLKLARTPGWCWQLQAAAKERADAD